MPSPAIDRVVQFARRAVLWTVGPVALLLRGPAIELAPPARCAGGLDLISILVFRAWPGLHVSPVFSTLQVVSVVLAFGLFAELAYRASGSMLIAGTLAATLGIGQPFVNSLAPPWAAAAFGACAASALAVHACLSELPGSVRARRLLVWTCVVLVATAALVPAWAATCALLVFATMQRRVAAQPRARTLSLIAPVIVVGAAVVIARAVNQAGSAPQWTTCIWSASASKGLTRARQVADMIGPIVMALGALGAYVAALRAGFRRTTIVFAFLALATAAASGGWPDGVVLAPVVVATWSLAAIGMREMRARVPGPHASVTVALLATVPLLQLSRASARGDDRNDLLGHDRVSLAQMRKLLNLVPAGATIVEEDATVDLMLRAAAFGGRVPKPLAIPSRERKDIASALATGPLYAFPLGQRELSQRGFVVDPIPGLPPSDSRGLAMISGYRACVELGKAWTDLGTLGMHGRVALVADSDASVGPVVVYFDGATGYTPGPDGWPPRAMPGFGLRMFDRGDQSQAALMDAEATTAGLVTDPVFAAPHVARLTLFRVAGAPLALPIVLGPARGHGVGKLSAESADALPLVVCDAPRVAISEF
jgi:hypothetical protein